MTFSSQNSSVTQLQWKPPYYTLNQESDIIHVDPHITQYTVYTIDAYTRRMIERENMTETSFTLRNNTGEDALCPIYQVSAWNAGGEGKMSESLQESIPQGNQVIETLQEINVTRVSCLCLSSSHCYS